MENKKTKVLDDPRKDEKGRIKKGAVLNPNGRPRLDAETKALQELGKHEMAKMIAEIRDLNTQEVKAYMDHVVKNGGPMFFVGALRAFYKFSQTGEYKWVEALINRAYGKPREQVKIETESPHDVILEIIKESEENE